ncbi:MAG: formate dehydrogenase accessory sulfurtransferase FdhD [Lachnospiraceae bacterium]|nr:formate dehydrogenase accessory sulfurtransferase FdhD [Lachnospiraceae bacterium]
MKIINKMNQYEKTGTEETVVAPVFMVKNGITVYPGGTRSEFHDNVLCEHFTEVSVNNIPFIRLSCTPSFLPELVTGRLYTEGLIDSADEVSSIYICGTGAVMEVLLTKQVKPAGHVYEEKTCCTGNFNRTTLEGARKPKNLPNTVIDKDIVFELVERFKNDSHLHRETFGTHSCYLRTPDGKIHEFEDISRHNAMDKAVGYALMNNYNLNECVLYTTGRIPQDMVYKCIMAGIPTLVSKSVPTDAALKMAAKYGLNLICCAWPDSYRIYTDDTSDRAFE